MPDSVKRQPSRTLVELVRLWPALPYMSLGLWLAWLLLAFGGNVWASSTELSGENISRLYIASALAMGVLCLILPFVSRRARAILERRRTLVLAAVLGASGSAAIIAAGPHYLGEILGQSSGMIIFLTGGVFAGFALGIMVFRSGVIFGALAPRRAILYTALSYLVIAAVYFVTTGAPTWYPMAQGPSLMGILMFVFLIPASAFLMMLSEHSKSADLDEAWLAKPQTLFSFRGQTVIFWKFNIMIFFFAAVIAVVSSAAIDKLPITTTASSAGVLMLLRIFVAFAAIVFTLKTDRPWSSFGKLYSIIAMFVIVTVAALPMFGSTNTNINLFIDFASMLFEFVVWSLLAFVAYQKHIYGGFIFSFGYGAFMFGNAIGLIIGIFVLPLIDAGEFAQFIYLVIAAVVLITAFFMFSESDIRKLFATSNDSEHTIEELFELSVDSANGEGNKKGHFAQALDGIAEHYHLTKRETEVLRYLAQGRGGDYIAEKMTVSWNTARSHIHNVYIKLGVHSRQDIIDMVDNETHKLS